MHAIFSTRGRWTQCFIHSGQMLVAELCCQSFRFALLQYSHLRRFSPWEDHCAPVGLTELMGIRSVQTKRHGTVPRTASWQCCRVSCRVGDLNGRRLFAYYLSTSTRYFLLLESDNHREQIIPTNEEWKWPKFKRADLSGLLGKCLKLRGCLCAMGCTYLKTLRWRSVLLYS